MLLIKGEIDRRVDSVGKRECVREREGRRKKGGRGGKRV